MGQRGFSFKGGFLRISHIAGSKGTLVFSPHLTAPLLLGLLGYLIMLLYLIFIFVALLGTGYFLCVLYSSVASWVT